VVPSTYINPRGPRATRCLISPRLVGLLKKANKVFSLTFSHTMKKKTVTATRWANINNRQTIQDQSIQGLSCKRFKEKRMNECHIETEHVRTM